MPSETRHIGKWITRGAAEVYEYASDPVHLPEWAPGLGSSVENLDGRWFVDSPSGKVGFAFVERNPYGVLDHEVTLPSGDVITTRCGSSPTVTALKWSSASAGSRT